MKCPFITNWNLISTNTFKVAGIKEDRNRPLFVRQSAKWPANQPKPFASVAKSSPQTTGWGRCSPSARRPGPLRCLHVQGLARFIFSTVSVPYPARFAQGAGRSASSTASGCLAITARRTRAGPSGRVRPCSQFFTEAAANPALIHYQCFGDTITSKPVCQNHFPNLSCKNSKPECRASHPIAVALWPRQRRYVSRTVSTRLAS